jgi:hypothetical protein
MTLSTLSCYVDNHCTGCNLRWVSRFYCHAECRYGESRGAKKMVRNVAIFKINWILKEDTEGNIFPPNCFSAKKIYGFVGLVTLTLQTETPWRKLPWVYFSRKKHFVALRHSGKADCSLNWQIDWRVNKIGKSEWFFYHRYLKDDLSWETVFVSSV